MDQLLEKMTEMGLSTLAFDLVEVLSNTKTSGKFLQFSNRLAIHIDVHAKFSSTGELRRFLIANFCPFSISEEDNVFNSSEVRSNIVDFLLSEAQACKMIQSHENPSLPVKTFQVEASLSSSTSPISEVLSSLCTALNIKTTEEDLDAKLKELSKELAKEVVKHPKLAAPPLIEEVAFNDGKRKRPEEMFEVLRDIYTGLSSDYATRRQVLVKRLEVTIQSCLWGGKGRQRVDEILLVLNTKLPSLLHSHVKFNDLYCANASIVDIPQVTSSLFTEHTGGFIKRHIIATVPDRGGRPGVASVSVGFRERTGAPSPAYELLRNDARSQSFRGRGGGQKRSFNDGQPQSYRH